MMKNFTKLFALVAVMFGFSLGASAQVSATSTDVAANATVIAPITIDAGSPLSFGDVVGAAGTVTVGSNGGRTGTDGLIVTTTLGTASLFTVGGETGYGYTITLPTDPVVLLNGAEEMTVTDFTSYIAGAAETVGTLTLGTSTFTVGATLNVALGQVSGTYAGTYDVTVAYN